MNFAAEIQRIWEQDRTGSAMLPPEKVFTGEVPDQIEDRKTKKQVTVNPPYALITFEDGLANGGTSLSIDRVFVMQWSAFSASRAEAERIRDRGRDLFLAQMIHLTGSEAVQDITLETDGEEDPVDGVFEVWQRFNVETAIERPSR